MKKFFRVPLADLLDETVTEALRNWFYVKHPKGRQCRMYELCDGVEKTYAKNFGLNALNPVNGEKILDPLFFRRNAFVT